MILHSWNAWRSGQQIEMGKIIKITPGHQMKNENPRSVSLAVYARDKPALQTSPIDIPALVRKAKPTAVIFSFG
jgi:hypothetical protein